MHTLVIHGGAGVVQARLTEAHLAQYKESLSNILDGCFEMLAQGASSLDTVTRAVEMLEDDPLFNAGRGAGLTRDRTAELDASIMDGRGREAGAVACVSHIKNPVRLARYVMEKSPHVLLVGKGAEEFALANEIELVPNSYFFTEARLLELQREQSGERLLDLIPAPKGTVGAVACDAEGNLAAATSTGGMTNKLPGRVGDTPIIGAGTYAKNGVCAVSATGHGEAYIRCAAAHHMASAVEYRGLAVDKAAEELIHTILPQVGGLGGVIAVDPSGRFAMDFNTQGMFRGARDSSGNRIVAIGRD